MFGQMTNVRMRHEKIPCPPSSKNGSQKKTETWKANQKLWLVLWNEAGKGITTGAWSPALVGGSFNENTYVEVLIGQYGPMDMHYALPMAQVFDNESDAKQYLINKLYGEIK